MKIIRIFAHSLFSFQYENESENELQRLVNAWNNVEFLLDFVRNNKSDIPLGSAEKQIVEQLLINAQEIDETLTQIAENPNRTMSRIFARTRCLQRRFIL